MAKPRSPGRSWTPLWLVCAAGFGCLGSVAFRAPAAPLPNLDIRGLKFEGDTVILQNGTRVELKPDEDGGVIFPNGQKIEAWGGLVPEGLLPEDTWVCHDNLLLAIRLPVPSKGRRKRLSKKTKFHYVKVKDMPNMWPLEIFDDVADDHRHFMFCPPASDNDRPEFQEWRLLVRRAKSFRVKNSGWSEERLFSVGPHRPCTTTVDEEPEKEETEAEEAAGSEAVAEQGAGADAAAEILDPSQGIGRPREVVAGDAAVGELAADMADTLLSSGWRPSSWQDTVAADAGEASDA
mmetsp:Transcript_81027/g.234968  ORF Transcript_81027/g.234968 Transcript_81027/m.234968 type:complete len:292 (-) Transcript_81027:95-970(-)